MSSLEKIQDLVCKKFGLVPRATWAKDIQRAIARISEKHGLGPNRFLDLAVKDSDILLDLTNYLTVEESFFFRHPDHYPALVRYLLDRLKDENQIVIASAGCSMGQEPYSIAMFLKSHLLPDQISKVSIVAFDLNQHFIDVAKQGVYYDWSFRQVEQSWIDRFFKRLENGEYRINSSVRRMVAFRRAPVQDIGKLFMENSVDAVFFRNVSIYMTPESNEEVLASISRVLKQNGRLFLAPSDVQPAGDTGRWILEKQASIFRNCKQDTPTVNDAISGTEPSIQAQHRFDDALLDLQNVRLPNEVASLAFAQSAVGNLSKGIETAASLIADPSSQKLGYMTCGLIYFSNGDFQQAVNQFRKMTFLDPDDPLAVFWYAYSLLKEGSVQRSFLQWSKLKRQLNLMSNSDLLDDHVTTVAQLRRTTERIMENLK